MSLEVSCSRWGPGLAEMFQGRALSIPSCSRSCEQLQRHILYKPSVVSTPMYCPGDTSVLKSSGGCSITGTSEIYLPCEPQGLLGCGSRWSFSMKPGAGGGSSCHKC